MPHLEGKRGISLLAAMRQLIEVLTFLLVPFALSGVMELWEATGQTAGVQKQTWKRLHEKLAGNGNRDPGASLEDRARASLPGWSKTWDSEALCWR